ncbi:M15 family metallopeptidase [Promicromonospora sp. Populi]|uniref:M15 family metallopeptidase n=1 Tax=Promicromonospora sp. Populi TaxID=3239420 RepID=UPI0034E1CDCB
MTTSSDRPPLPRTTTGARAPLPLTLLPRAPLLLALLALALLLLLAGCAPGAIGTVFQEPRAAGATPESLAPPGSAELGPADPAPAPAPAPPSDEPAIDLAAHSITDPTSPWVVVNKGRPLDPAFEPDLTTVRGYLVQPAAAPDLTALLAAADADGVHLTLRSAYRAYAKQAQVYEGWVAQLGAAEADKVSARPGHSEHQTGLGVDVGSSTQAGCDFEKCFGETVEGRWVAEHAAAFGFVVRYTPQNSAVTGYAAEAWHLRWVGRELAAYMRDTGVTTLEEVFDVPGGGYAR